MSLPSKCASSLCWWLLVVKKLCVDDEGYIAFNGVTFMPASARRFWFTSWKGIHKQSTMIKKAYAFPCLRVEVIPAPWRGNPKWRLASHILILGTRFEWSASRPGPFIGGEKVFHWVGGWEKYFLATQGIQPHSSMVVYAQYWLG
jgi:hypothetical protein